MSGPPSVRVRSLMRVDCYVEIDVLISYMRSAEISYGNVVEHQSLFRALRSVNSRIVTRTPLLYAITRIYSNRAAAYEKLGKHGLALADAFMCTTLQPAWPKGYFRNTLHANQG